MILFASGCGRSSGIDSTRARGSQSCISEVAKLPPSPLYDREDSRLYGDALIVVLKGQRRLMRYSGGHLASPAHCWTIGLAKGAPLGDKQLEGDHRTPEGWYRTSDKPESHRPGAIAIHYPNADDTRRAVAGGRIDQRTGSRILAALGRDEKPPQQTRLGGEILIHGGGATDQTEGCIALSDEELYQLRALLPEDMVTDVLILP